MTQKDGCTCYDETTTRKCPIEGHPEKPKRLKIYTVQKERKFYRRKQYIESRRCIDDPQRASIWTVYQGPSAVLREYPTAKRIDLEIKLPC